MVMLACLFALALTTLTGALGAVRASLRQKASSRTADPDIALDEDFIWEQFGINDDDDAHLETMVPPAVQLAMDAPCAPDLAALQEAGLLEVVNASQTPRTLRALPKFYMFVSNAFNFSDVISCFLVKAAGPRSGHRADTQIRHHLHDYLVDLNLLSKLEVHPARTMNRSEADIFVAGAPFGISYHSKLLDDTPCGNATDHENRMALVREELKSLPEFQATPDRFVIVQSDWDWQDVLTKELAIMIAETGAILVSRAADFATEGGVSPDNLVIIPAIPHGIVEDSAFDTPLVDDGLKLLEVDRGGRDDVAFGAQPTRTISSATFDGMQRNLSFGFYGPLEQASSAPFRYCMREMRSMLPGTSLKEVTDREFSSDRYSDNASETATTLLRSKYCFVPADSASSSRQLVDALAAGCVPIIFGSMEVVAPNLPFRHTIDWTSLALFAGDASCTVASLGGTVYWLGHLSSLSKFNKITMEMMHSNGRKAFRRWLSYRTRGVAGALLMEISKLRNITGTSRDMLAMPPTLADRLPNATAELRGMIGDLPNTTAQLWDVAAKPESKTPELSGTNAAAD